MRIVPQALLTLSLLFAMGNIAGAETCTTESQMSTGDRTVLSEAARSLASHIQSNDAAGLRGLSVPEVTQDFAAVTEAVTATAPHLKGGTLFLHSVYLLDASTLKRGTDGSATDAQFFCSLNRTVAETDFLIPTLPSGRYAFAIVEVRGVQAPWRLSFLLRQEAGQWLMAGLYPKPETAAGHDGLWYWKEARTLLVQKAPLDAWLYLQEAESLLQPVGFVQSTHLEKLHTEQTSAAPPALSEGVSPDAPLVIKAKDGNEFRFTSLTTDDSLPVAGIDVAAHMKTDAVPAGADAAAPRRRNITAMSALVAAYPELRKSFHGVWIFADAPGQTSYATEQAMSDIP